MNFLINLPLYLILGLVLGIISTVFQKKLLTKDIIIQQIICEHLLLEYLSDKLNKSTITLEFLFAFLFDIKKEKTIIYTTFIIHKI